MADVTSFDGTRLALCEWGPPDAPPVLLVHGLGLSTSSWGDVPERLAGDWAGRRLRPAGARAERGRGLDRLRHGRQARDLDAVLRAVLPDGARVLLVGHSLGGGIVEKYAGDFGTGRVAGAVLVGSTGSAVTVPGLPARRLPDRAAPLLRSGWFAVLRATARLGRRIRSMDALADRLVRRYAFSADAPDELVAQVRKSFLSSRPQALAATTLGSVDYDGVAGAPELDVPTRVLRGSADYAAQEEDVQQLIAALPDAELVTFEGAGHMLPLTHGPDVATHVDRWARRTLGR